MSSLFRGLARIGAPALKRFTPAVSTFVQAGQPAWVEWDTNRAIRHGLKASAWAYICTRMIMERGSQVTFGVQRKGANGRWQFDWEDELSLVLAWWNEQEDASESIARCLCYLTIGGNAIIGKVPGRFVVRELDVQSPVDVRPVPDALGNTVQYEYRSQGAGGRGIWLPRWDVEDVCHARLVDPENPLWGMSRLRAIAKEVDTDVAAVDWNKRRIELGGVPDGILIDESITNEVDRRDAQAEVDASWRDISGPFVQGAGVDWIQLGLGHQDLQWLQGREWSMRVIVNGFGFNPALFGSDATFANYATAERSAWTSGILPPLNILAGALTRGCIPRAERARRRIWYDTSKIEALQADLGKLVETYIKLIAGGVPPDVAKDLLGLPIPDLPEGMGKVPLISSTLDLLSNLIESEGINDVKQQLADAQAALAKKPGAAAKPKPGAVVDPEAEVDPEADPEAEPA